MIYVDPKMVQKPNIPNELDAYIDKNKIYWRVIHPECIDLNFVPMVKNKPNAVKTLPINSVFVL